MTSYNTVLKKSLAALILVVMAGACAKKDTHTANGKGATFFVDSVNATVTPDELNSNEAVNRKFINFTACIKDNAQQSAVMNLKFQITAGAITTTKITDDRGCLIWQELFAYDPYEDEKQIPLVRSITALQGHSGSEVVQLAYNPWDGDKVVFTKREAAREIQSAKIIYTHGGQIKSTSSAAGADGAGIVTVDFQTTLVSKNLKQTYITNMTMQFLKRDFEQYAVNQNLSLTIAHQYRLKFSSSAVRKSLSQGLVAQNINAGHFRVYFVLLREGYDPKEVSPEHAADYIVSANQIDTVASMGRVIKDTTLRFTNLAALASRLIGVMTIISTDDTASFAESNFEGTLSPVAGGSTQSIDLIDSSLNAHDLFEKYNVAQAKQVQNSTITQFDKFSGYVALDRAPVKIKTNAIFGPSEANVDLYGYFQKKSAGQNLTAEEQKNFNAGLCYAYFNGTGLPGLQNAYNICMRHPEKMIKVEMRSFVDRVESPTVKKIGLPHTETLSVSSSVTFSDAKTKASGVTTAKNISLYANAGADLGLSLPLGAAALGSSKTGLNASAAVGGKVAIGRDWFWTSGATKTNNSSNGNSANRSMDISTESFKFEIDVTARKCMLISPTAELNQSMAETKHPMGKYFCEDQGRRQTATEEYFFLNQSSGLSSSPMSDNMSAEDNPFRMFIRGRDTYNRFAQVFAQKGIDIVLQKIPDQKITQDFSDFYITQDYPGMLSQ